MNSILKLKIETDYFIINDVLNNFWFFYFLFYVLIIIKFIKIIKLKQLNTISFVWTIIIIELMYISVMIGSKIEVVKGCLGIIAIFKTPYYVFILFSILYFLSSKFLNSKKNEVIINSELMALIIFAAFNSIIGFAYIF